MKKTDGREKEEQQKHDDERSTMNKDKDKQYPDKDKEHEISVSSWNINKSSARYDFLRDMAQCQVDVAMFQETQNWHHEDGAAAEVGWNFFRLGKEGKAAIVFRNMFAEVQDGCSLCWKASCFSLCTCFTRGVEH